MTIAHSEPSETPDFHFYRDLFDLDGVYLMLIDTKFEITERCATVRIPIEVWNQIVVAGVLQPQEPWNDED